MVLRKWLFDMNEKGTHGKIYWPPRDDTVQKYIERNQEPDPLTWRVYKVKVKRYKGMQIILKVLFKFMIFFLLKPKIL